MTANVNGIPLPMAGWFAHAASQDERTRIVHDGWKNCRECANGYWTNDDEQLTCKNCRQLENGGN